MDDMKTFLITDLHLGHKNIVKYCGRPENHNELILENISKVFVLTEGSPCSGDRFICLGDVCMGHDTEWHEKLMSVIPNGVYKILIRGNHDRKSNKWYLDHGWDEVCLKLEVVLPDYSGKVLLSHYPTENLNGYCMNIHGHWHTKDESKSPEYVKFYNPKFHKKLAIEETGYVPLEVFELIEKYKSNE